MLLVVAPAGVWVVPLRDVEGFFSSPFLNLLRCNSFELYIPGFVGLEMVALAEANGGVVAVTPNSADVGPCWFEVSVAESPASPVVADDVTAGSLLVVWLMLAVELPAAVLAGV